MKTYEFSPIIIDRDEESNKIIMDLEHSTGTKVHIVYAKSAIGKSTLSQKVIDRYAAKDRQIITVSTNPENKTTSATEWLYVDKIFESCDKYFSNSNLGLSFEDYIYNSKDKVLKKQIYENIAEELITAKSKLYILLTPIYYKMKRAMRIGEFNPYKYIENNTFNSKLLKVRYIHYLMDKTDIFLIIDNMQNIDRISWKYLLDWLNETKHRKHYLLFEYTLSESLSTEEVLRQAEQIKSTGAAVAYSKLDIIPAKYAVDIIDKHFPSKPDDLAFNINLLNHYKNKCNGNIRSLIDYTIGYSPQKQTVSNPTLENIINLKEPEKYILALIIYCNGTIEYKLLVELCNLISVTKQEVDDSLTTLKNNLQIRLSENKIQIYHATIIDQWKQNIHLIEEFDQLAYIQLEKYFTNVLYSKISDSEKSFAWLTLLRIYAANSPSKIEDLLDELNSGVISYISPDNAWQYLSLLIENTKSNIPKLINMYYKILHICFEIELYEKGYLCIELLEKSINIESNILLILYKSMYLSALDRHKENIYLYHKYLSKMKLNSRAYFHLNLMVLCSFRSLNNYDKCLEIHHEIMSRRLYMHEYDYALFLRLTNIYLPDHKAIRYAKNSVKKFHQLRDPYQEAKSMITYSKLLSGLGKGHKAIKVIKEAEHLFIDRKIGKHMILVNQAAFLLMQGKSNKNIWFLLDQAECSAIVPYDKLAIIVNKLVWCYENEKYDIIDLLINQANKLIPWEPDEHVHILIYYNLYLLFIKIGDTTRSNFYYELSYKNRYKCKFVKARIEGLNSKELRHRLKHPWHVCYLSFWTYDIESDFCSE